MNNNLPVYYICDRNQCNGRCTYPECYRTTNIDYAVNFERVIDDKDRLVGYEEVRQPDCKEVRIWGIGTNADPLEKGCCMTFYNEDENGDEHDSVYINLTPKNMRDMIRCLEMYLVKED